MTDATTALIDAISVNFVNFAVEDIRSRSWVSATFSGVRHELTFTAEGEGAQAAADLFLHGLEEREFDLSGHVLADIALVSQSTGAGAQGPLVRISLEALTLEDG
jgi:2-phospho-L-lactate transferase/gluconeogenesis factor (CofD/UPF0052 family)